MGPSCTAISRWPVTSAIVLVTLCLALAPAHAQTAAATAEGTVLSLAKTNTNGPGTGPFLSQVEFSEAEGAGDIAFITQGTPTPAFARGGIDSLGSHMHQLPAGPTCCR